MHSHRNRQHEVLLDIVQIQFQGKTISMSPLLTGGNKVEFDYVNKNKGIKMYSINFLCIKYRLSFFGIVLLSGMQIRAR